MEFKAVIPRKKIIRTYIDILNSLLELTDRERDVLSLIVEIDMMSESDDKNVIDMNSRRYIMQNTFINKNNLSKYISKFKEKKILVEYSPKKWCIDKNMIPSSLKTKNEVNINFNLKIN